MRTRPRFYVLSAVAFGLLVTGLVLVVPGFRFAYKVPRLHLVLETAEGFIALLAAWLLVGRFQRDRSLSQLLLIVALAMLGIANIALSVIPPLAGASETEAFSTWAPLVVRSSATVMIASVALSPATGREVRAGLLPAGFGLAVIYIAVVSGVIALFPQLFGEPELIRAAGRSGTVLIPGLDAVIALQVLLAILWGLAAYGFTRRAEATGDEFATWLAAAAAVSMTARLSYLLFPSLYTGYVYVGDLLRLVFHLLLLAGAVREIGSYWERVAHIAKEDERRRLARDLHDGIAQELLFVAAQTRTARHLAPAAEVDTVLHRLQNAADRAVDEARRAIHAVTVADDEDLESALRHLASYMDVRVDARVDLKVEQSFDVDRSKREDVIRIVREAIVNSYKHSGSGSIEVVVGVDGTRSIAVHDKGRGFSVDDPAGDDSFGLISMRERAAAIGARVDIRSGPGGTTVELIL